MFLSHSDLDLGLQITDVFCRGSTSHFLCHAQSSLVASVSLTSAAPHPPHISPVMPGSLGQGLFGLTTRSPGTTLAVFPQRRCRFVQSRCSFSSRWTLDCKVACSATCAGSDILPAGRRLRGETLSTRARIVTLGTGMCVCNSIAGGLADWPQGHQRPLEPDRCPSLRPVPLSLSTGLSSARSSPSDSRRW